MIETLEVKKNVEQGNVNHTLMGIPEADSLAYPELKTYFKEKRENFGLI